MHVLQYIAVQADNEDMAMRSVGEMLNSELGHDQSGSNAWFDWFVIGGGRFVDGDPYASSPNNIISYKDKPEEFVTMINRMILNREVEFAGYRKNFESRGISLSDSLDKYDGNTDFSFELYELGKMIDMLQGRWDFNSYFYDMHHYSTGTKYLLDTLNDSWYIVPVDFHF